MLEIEDVSQFAKGVAERYSAFSLSLMGLYGKALDGYSPLSVRARSTFARQASNEALTAAETLSEHLHKISREVSVQAISDVAGSTLSIDELSTITQAVLEAATAVSDSIYTQMKRDIATVENMYRKLVIKTGMMSRANGWSQSASFMAARQSQNVRFRFMDRAGRSWDSKRYVHTAVRGHLLNIYNDVTLYTLTQNGEKMARLRDQNDVMDKYEFLIVSDGSNKTTYQDIINSGIIHPNCSLLATKS